MEMENLNFVMEAGQVFIATKGEYSGYGVIGHFRALAEFNFGEIKEAYVKANPKEAWDFETSRFIAFLIRHGWIEEVEGIANLHLSDYGEWETVDFYSRWKE